MLLLLQNASVAGTLFVGVSDTTSLSATEGDVTDFTSDVLDSFDLTITDIATLAVAANRSDTASLSLVEVAVVSASGAVTIAGTDTASISITDTSVVDVAIAVTDTTSLQLTGETGGTPAVFDVINSVTDTASLTLTDAGTVDRRTFNQVDFAVNDTTSLALQEAGRVTRTYPVSRAKFKLGAWSIKFRIRN